MDRKRRHAVIRNAILLSLLAVLCIGGAELAACRAEDPALYSAIVAPAEQFGRDISARAAAMWDGTRARAAVLWNGARARAVSLWEAAGAELSALLHPPAPAEDVQLAGEPAVRTRFLPAPPEITSLVTTEGREYLLGGNLNLPYFNQADAAWADKPFGIDPIGGYGCGPTALSMAVSGLTGETVTPAALAAWAADAGYAAPHSGSYLTIVEGAAEQYGLDCSPLEPDADALCRQLNAGGVVVALMGPGHFTRSGHFILLHGVTLTGEVLVADPYSRENSLMTWDPRLLIGELSASRYAGAPLWLLTKPAGL